MKEFSQDVDPPMIKVFYFFIIIIFFFNFCLNNLPSFSLYSIQQKKILVFLITTLKKLQDN